MEIIKTAIDGVLIIEPKVFGDKKEAISLSHSHNASLMRKWHQFLVILSTLFKITRVCQVMA